MHNGLADGAEAAAIRRYHPGDRFVMAGHDHLLTSCHAVEKLAEAVSGYFTIDEDGTLAG